jgi:hypothetical protein
MNTKLGSTAIVELNGTLGNLGFLIKGVPAKVKSAVTEVTREVTGLSTVGRVLHYEELKEADEGNDLEKTGLGDGVVSEKGGNTVGVGVKGVSSHIDGSRKVDSVTGHDLSKERKLTNTAVLHLHVTKAVETLLIGISEHAKRIKETKRRLGAKLILKRVERRGRLSNLSGGKGGRRGGKEGGDDELHCFFSLQNANL